MLFQGCIDPPGSLHGPSIGKPFTPSFSVSLSMKTCLQPYRGRFWAAAVTLAWEQPLRQGSRPLGRQTMPSYSADEGSEH